MRDFRSSNLPSPRLRQAGQTAVFSLSLLTQNINITRVGNGYWFRKFHLAMHFWQSLFAGVKTSIQRDALKSGVEHLNIFIKQNEINIRKRSCLIRSVAAEATVAKGGFKVTRRLRRCNPSKPPVPAKVPPSNCDNIRAGIPFVYSVSFLYRPQLSSSTLSPEFTLSAADGPIALSAASISAIPFAKTGMKTWRDPKQGWQSDKYDSCSDHPSQFRKGSEKTAFLEHEDWCIPAVRCPPLLRYTHLFHPGEARGRCRDDRLFHTRLIPLQTDNRLRACQPHRAESLGPAKLTIRRQQSIKTSKFSLSLAVDQ